MLAAESIAPVESPSASAPEEKPPEQASQALLEISKSGVIVWAASEATAWWLATADAPLTGRPLASLFSETSGKPVETAWTDLLELGRGAGSTLTAQTPAGSFTAQFQLTAKGDPNALGDDTFIASIERSVLPTSAAPAPAAPTPGSTLATQPESPGSERIGKKAELDLPEIADDDLDESLDDESADDDLNGLTLPEMESSVSTKDPDDTSSLELPVMDRLHASARAVDAAPEASTAGIESALAGARIGFFQVDLTAGSARLSDSWKGLLGYDPDDVADEPDALATLIHPDDSEASPLALRHAGPFSVEVRLRTKDDTWRWMQIEGVCTAGANDRLCRIDGVMLDAQERHDADEETALNEERFLRITSRGSSGFFEIDLLEERAWYSPEFRRALGRRAEELGTTPDGFLKVLPPEDAEVGIAPFFQSITTGLPALVARYQLVHVAGRLVEFDCFLVVRRNRRGVIEHISGLQAPAGDTPRPDPAAEGPQHAAPSSSGGLADAVQAALDAATESIVLIDPTGRILHTNARAAALVGEQPDRITTRSIHEVYTLINRTTGAPAPETIDRVLNGSQSFELDQSHALLTRDGPEEIALSCSPIFDNKRHLTGATVVLRRSSELPLSQAEMVKSNRMEALGRLACGIVHDFNNLLTTVVGGVSLALDKRDLAPLDTALKACNNAKNLARQLLTFARGDVAGRRVQSLNDIIRETARMAGAGSKTTVELELSADLHPVNVVTSQLVQVFTNLILNAMQVMPTGGRIWVRTLNMPLGQVNSVNLPPGEYVRTDVQDNGPGIPPENLARIFEPFFTTRAEGTGLGLAMVNSIIAQHEGAVEASSTVGSGTTFTVYFPRAQTEVVQEKPQKISMSYGTGRVLVMDDDADLCAIASGMLDMLGYQADTATSADEAIMKFRKSRELNRAYAAVILDLTMAGGPGGEDVVSSLRAIDPNVKAIVSSGYATDDNAEHYHKLGFTGILSKPYRSGDLGRVLKEVVGPPK